MKKPEDIEAEHIIYCGKCDCGREQALLEEVETLRAAVVEMAKVLEVADKYNARHEDFGACEEIHYYHNVQAALYLPAVVALRTEKTS